MRIQITAYSHSDVKKLVAAIEQLTKTFGLDECQASITLHEKAD